MLRRQPRRHEEARAAAMTSEPQDGFATGRVIEHKKPSTHAEHTLLLPLEQVRAVVIRLHEVLAQARRSVRRRAVASTAWGGRAHSHTKFHTGQRGLGL